MYIYAHTNTQADDGVAALQRGATGGPKECYHYYYVLLSLLLLSLSLSLLLLLSVIYVYMYMCIYGVGSSKLV